MRGRLDEISKDIVGKDGKNEPKESYSQFTKYNNYVNHAYWLL